MLTLQVLGGCREEGRAAFLLRADGHAWLLDCGVKRIIANDHVGEYPLLDNIDCEKIDAVILSHAHEDHCAALPLLYQRGYAGKVYCTPPTAELAVEYCHTWRKTVERYGFSAPYSTEDIARVRFAPIPLGKEIDLGLKIKFLPSGHLIGSAMSLLRWQGHRIVYTGDVTFESRLIEEPPIDSNPEAMIIDGSYGTRDITRTDAESSLLTLIRAAVTQGGSVLLPLPRFGRSQEVLLFLYDHRTELPPIFVEANIRDACAEYLKRKDWLRAGMAGRLQDILAAPCFHFIESVEERRAAVQSTPAIFLATDAMLSNGPVLDLFYALAGAPQHLVVLNGHQAPGTSGCLLEQGAREIETPQGRLTVRARVEMVTLKVHPSYEENLRLIGDGAPRVFIAHSEGAAVDDLERALRIQGLTAIAPELGATHEMFE